jgi:hypothetical protein
VHARTDRQLMNIPRVILILIASIVGASCSEKSGQDQKENSKTEERTNTPPVEPSSVPAPKVAEAQGESEPQPAEDEIAQDCVAFLRSTKTVPPTGPNGDCPHCPSSTEATEVLRFNDIRVDRITRSEETREVEVTIHATFNPSRRENIAGGLTAWISPEQRAKYLQGEAPSDQQAYKVKVIYHRVGKGWRAVEFDRP